MTKVRMHHHLRLLLPHKYHLRHQENKAPHPSHRPLRTQRTPSPRRRRESRRLAVLVAVLRATPHPTPPRAAVAIVAAKAVKKAATVRRMREGERERLRKGRSC